MVDIGSNTVRLVVYDTPNRLPVPIFNEKASCQLGLGLEKTGYLNPEGVASAFDSLTRFIRLAEAMGVERMDLVATAAVRDATDGPDFVTRIEGELGVKVQIPSGAEEAQLAALGLLSGTPCADGVLVDMGGGSVDLVELNSGTFGRTISLPLGHLRLPEAADNNIARAREIIDAELAKQPWLAEGKGRSLFAIGGSWRALGRVFIDQTGYPLHVIDGYTMKRADVQKLCPVVSHLGPESAKGVPGIAKARVRSLPYAAMILEAMLAATSAKNVVFSGFGMREGQLRKMLPAGLGTQDPLLSGCAAMAERTGRFAITGKEIFDWISPLFPPERDAESRLRMAASMLSDIGWDEHPDYRAEHSFLRTLRLPFAGLSHADRVFISLAIFIRYNGSPNNELVRSVGSLMTDYDLEHANVTGLALRLALTISGSAPGILSKSHFVMDDTNLSLKVHNGSAGDRQIFSGDAVVRRLKTLARALGREPIIE